MSNTDPQIFLRRQKRKDKAKAEAAVLLVECWILTRQRHRTFFSSSRSEARQSRGCWKNSMLVPFGNLLVVVKAPLKPWIASRSKPFPQRPTITRKWKRVTHLRRCLGNKPIHFSCCFVVSGPPEGGRSLARHRTRYGDGSYPYYRYQER